MEDSDTARGAVDPANEDIIREDISVVVVKIICLGEEHSKVKVLVLQVGGLRHRVNPSILVNNTNVKTSRRKSRNERLKQRRPKQRKRIMNIGTWNVQGICTRLNENLNMENLGC